MTIIQVNCIDQVLTITNSPLIASGGVKEDFVQFSFDSNWDGFGKLAMFYRYGEEETIYESAIDSDGLCEIPHEVISTNGKLCFGVTGVNGGDIRTSEILVYDIEKGSPRSGQTSEPAPTSVYNQMLAIAEEINEKANQVDSQIAVVQTAIDNHVGNSVIHVTSADKTNWNALDDKIAQVENDMIYHAGETITFDAVTAVGYTYSDNPYVNSAPENAKSVTVDIPLPKMLESGLRPYGATIANPDVAVVIARSVKGRIKNLDNRTISTVPGTFRLSTNFPNSIGITYTAPNEEELLTVDETLEDETQRAIPEETVACIRFRNLKILLPEKTG